MKTMPFAAVITIALIVSNPTNLVIHADAVDKAPRQNRQPKSEIANKPARLWDHRGSVLTMAITGDGNRLVTGGASDSETVVFWDLNTGQRLHGLKGAGLVYSLSLSPDGSKVATAGYLDINADAPTPKAAIWDAATGKELFALRNDLPGPRPCIAFSPNGKLLATGTFTGDDEGGVGAVQLWNSDTGKKNGELLVGPSEAIGRLAFSPDGKTLAAASWGAETFVVLWDVETRKRQAILKIKKTWTVIRSLTFSADGKQLVWATGNEVSNNVEHVLWDVTTAKRIASLRSPDGMAGIVFHPTRKALIGIGLDLSFETWDLGTFKRAAVIDIAGESPAMAHTVALSPDGKTLVVGTGNPDALMPPDAGYGSIRLFDPVTGRERLTPERERRRARDEAYVAARQAGAAKVKAQHEEEERQELAKLSPALLARQLRQSAVAGHLLYALHLNQAQQAVERGQFAVAMGLLSKHKPQAGQEDLRGFEWHYLWRQCQFQHRVMEPPDPIYGSWQGVGPLLSADGKTLAAVTVEHEVALWDVTTGKEYPRLNGAAGSIWHMAFSPDGKYLVTAGGMDGHPRATFPPKEEKDDPSMRDAFLWEVSTGKRVATFDGSKKAIACIALSTDGNLLAIGDYDSTVRTWEIPSAKQVASLKVGLESAATLSFSPDDKVLAVGGVRGGVGLWELATRKETPIREGKEKKPIISLRFALDGNALYSTEGDWSDNYAARRWSRNALGQWVTSGNWKLVNRLALSPDGKRLALSGWHGVALWDVETDREVACVVPRESGGGLDSHMAFSPDSGMLLVHADHIIGQPLLALFDAVNGKRLGVADNVVHQRPYGWFAIHLRVGGRVTAITLGSTGREQETIQVLQTTLGQVARLVPASRARSGIWYAKGTGADSLAFSPDQRQLVLTNGEAVFLWDMSIDSNREIFKTNSKPIRDVGFSADGKTVLATHSPGVKLLNPETGTVRASIAAHYGLLSGDGKSVFVGYSNETIAVFSAATGQKSAGFGTKASTQVAEKDADPVQDALIASRSCKWVVAFGTVLFDAPAKKEIKRWERDPLPLSFAFTPDDRTLVTSDRKGTLIVWDLPTLKERHVVPGLGYVGWRPTGTIVLSPDNRTAALTQSDGSILLFDLDSGTEIAQLTGLGASVGAVTFSPDGRSLVTSSDDGTLRFWCPLTGTQRLNLRPSGGVTSLTFSPDGTILATGGATVRLWYAR